MADTIVGDAAGVVFAVDAIGMMLVCTISGVVIVVAGIPDVSAFDVIKLDAADAVGLLTKFDVAVEAARLGARVVLGFILIDDSTLPATDEY